MKPTLSAACGFALLALTPQTVRAIEPAWEYAVQAGSTVQNFAPTANGGSSWPGNRAVVPGPTHRCRACIPERNFPTDHPARGGGFAAGSRFTKEKMSCNPSFDGLTRRAGLPRQTNRVPDLETSSGIRTVASHSCRFSPPSSEGCSWAKAMFADGSLAKGLVVVGNGAGPLAPDDFALPRTPTTEGWTEAWSLTC